MSFRDAPHQQYIKPAIRTHESVDPALPYLTQKPTFTSNPDNAPHRPSSNTEHSRDMKSAQASNSAGVSRSISSSSPLQCTDDDEEPKNPRNGTKSHIANGYSNETSDSNNIQGSKTSQVGNRFERQDRPNDGFNHSPTCNFNSAESTAGRTEEEATVGYDKEDSNNTSLANSNNSLTSTRRNSKFQDASDAKPSGHEKFPGHSKALARANEDDEEVPITRQDSETSLADQDEDVKSDGSGDLQFRKKDFSKSRTQSFQSVLSSASLKSLKQQFAAPSLPQLHRNPSTVSQGHTKNFQSFIQAPVLSSVTNLRNSDIEIGQRLPFDHRQAYENRALDAESASLLTETASLNATDPENGESTEAEDIYKEETTLQQQKLTLNALKKLSLSLAPIIRSDEDDDDGTTRQLTTKSLHASRAEPRPESLVNVKEARSKPQVSASDKRPRPYQPAEVDLSSFSSLTRQSKHMGQALVPKATVSETIREDKTKEGAHATNVSAQRPHNHRSEDSGATIKQIPEEYSTGSQTGGSKQASDQPPSIAPVFKSSEDTSAKQGNKSPKAGQKTGESAPRTFARSTMQMNSMRSIGSVGGEFKAQVPPKPSSVKMPDKKLQQINGFRSPMYVPAVLRKTNEDSMEYNSSDADGYFDQRHAGEANAYESSSTSVKSFDSGYSTESVGSSAQKMMAPYTLNRRQYEYILRTAPTRKHWQRDESVLVCSNQACNKRFNFFERRHHCRKCGGIFCKEHTSHYLYINHLAQFTTGGRGTLSRVCDNCIEEYNEFMKHEFGVSLAAPVSRESLVEREAHKVDYRKEVLVANMGHAAKDDQKVPEQLAGSVPANWSWSSF